MCTKSHTSLTSFEGFQATAANLLTVPVYVFAFIVACLFGVVGDKYGQRGYIDMLVLMLCVSVSPTDTWALVD